MSKPEIDSFFEDDLPKLPRDEAEWQKAIEESQRLFDWQEIGSIPETRLHAFLEILKEYAPWIAAAISPLVLGALYLFLRRRGRKE